MSDVQYNNRKLVCIEYPGLFRSADKMMETLGGQQSVDKIHSEPSRRLELRFRPRDTYCKCVHGERFNTTNLLLKVKKRRKPVSDSDTKSREEYEYTMEILGIVDTTYKFRGMMDFQYLPMERTSEKTYKPFASEIIPRGMEPTSWLDKSTAPLFILPVVFSRMDTPTNYHYRTDPVKKNEPKVSKLQKANPAIIGKGRQPRAGHTISVSFEDPVPEKPNKDAECQLNPKIANSPLLESVRKAFEERPIWSKNAIFAIFDIERNALKQILPLVAYNCIMGPWRSLWIRYNYDPRKTTESKIYQLFDFRVKQTLGEESHVCPKRSSSIYTLPSKITTSQARIPTIQTEELAQTPDPEAQTKVVNKEEKELQYMFKPDHLPPHRQNFYQLCDICIPEVQRLIHSNDGAETTCTEKNGWLEPGILEECRKIMCHYLDQAKRKRKEKEKSSKDIKSIPATMAESSNSDPHYIQSEEDVDMCTDDD